MLVRGLQQRREYPVGRRDKSVLPLAEHRRRRIANCEHLTAQWHAAALMKLVASFLTQLLPAAEQAQLAVAVVAIRVVEAAADFADGIAAVLVEGTATPPTKTTMTTAVETCAVCDAAAFDSAGVVAVSLSLLVAS